LRNAGNNRGALLDSGFSGTTVFMSHRGSFQPRGPNEGNARRPEELRSPGPGATAPFRLDEPFYAPRPQAPGVPRALGQQQQTQAFDFMTLVVYSDRGGSRSSKATPVGDGWVCGNPAED